MPPEFVDYCAQLGLGKALIDRANGFYKHFAAFSQERIETIFISDVVKEDGTRDFLNLLFFSLHHVYDAVNFVGDPSVTISPLRFVHLEYGTSNFDFTSPGPESRLVVTAVFFIGSRYTLQLRASGHNCSRLVEVVRTFLMKPLF